MGRAIVNNEDYARNRIVNNIILDKKIVDVVAGKLIHLVKRIKNKS